MRRAIFVGGMVLLSGVAVAGVFGGGGGGAGAAVDVLAELVGKNVNAASYTATTTTGPAFIATGDRVDAIRLGSGSRATIGTNAAGDIFIGPNDFGYTTSLYLWGGIVTQGIQVRSVLDVLGPGAYITNNDGMVQVFDPDGFSINGSTAIKALYIEPPAVIDLPQVSNGSCSTMDYALAKAKVGDFVGVQAEFDYGEDAPDVTVRGGRVPVDGTVRIRFCNSSPMTEEDPPSGPYTIRLERR